MIEIPAEKLAMLRLPKIMELNHKPGAPMHRSKSAHENKFIDMNEWEGGERHFIKIEKYMKNEIKKRKLANGRPKEDPLLASLKKQNVENKEIIEKLQSKSKELTDQLILQTETIQFSKKFAEQEFNRRKDKLKEKLTEICQENILKILDERILFALQKRKTDLNKIVLDLIKEKLSNEFKNI